MGWTGTHRPRGQSLKDFFQEQWGSGTNTILDFATVKRSTCYAAVQNNQTGEVFGVVILVKYSRDYHYNITYKDMDETMGPNESECPARILALLSPTTHKYALAWRERCRANLAKPVPKYGDVIRFDAPLHFTNGWEDDTFTVERYGQRGKCYISKNHGFRAQITNIKQRKFSIVR